MTATSHEPTAAAPSSTGIPAGDLLPAALRDDFPILGQQVHGDRPLIYLDSAASTQRPRQVLDSLRRLYEHDYANVHRGIHVLSERATDQYETARDRMRQFLGAEHFEEIIFTSGTTAAINLVARSWGDANVRAGDEILVTEMEHHSNLVPWHQLAARTGASVRAIPITDDGLLRLKTLDDLLTARTKLVAISHVSNVLGTINPVQEIARRAHEAGAVVLVDAAQSVPHLPVNVIDLGADFLAYSGHKMVGPSGVGVLYGKRELLSEMPPFMGGGSMIREVFIDRFTAADLPARFEAGTPPIAPAIGLAAAVDYLEAIGLEAIHAHEQALARYAYGRLAEIEGIRILGPAPELRAGLVAFAVDGIHAHDVAQVLDYHGIAVRPGHHCTMPLHARLGVSASTRASFYLYNQPHEVDALAAAIEAVKSKFRRGRRRR